jgi:signal transduction histidine kinase
VLIALCGEPGKLEPFFRLQGGQSVDPPAAPLLATRLLSSSAYPVDRRHTSFLLPLTCEAEYLGVAVFQPGSGLGVCGMLREQISGAVKSVALHREIAQQTALHERTDRERAAATERMESLSVMAGGVAHDLNSALSPLVMLPDLMLRQLDELVIDATENGRRLRQHVETIKSAGRRATQTVKDLMTLGGQGRAPKAPLDLNRLVASCLSAEPLLVMHQEEPRVDVTVRLYPQPLVVHASQHHVERAISNLIRNAVESIHLDGLISVTTSQACLTEPRLGHETVAAGDYAVVTVSDTGQGIPPELLGRVFEPFFTKKKLRDSSGSGLGLSIVHGVVKEHQGFVDVASTPGTGTTFTLYFPLSTNSPSVVPDPEP